MVVVMVEAAAPDRELDSLLLLLVLLDDTELPLDYWDCGFCFCLWLWACGSSAW